MTQKAIVIVIVNVSVTASFTPSSAVTVTVWARTAASAATVPDTLLVSGDHVRPVGSPDTVTSTVSPSASVTAMGNSSIAAPCAYSLSPGFVIAGALFIPIVIVNAAVTASFTPSSAVTVTV